LQRYALDVEILESGPGHDGVNAVGTVGQLPLARHGDPAAIGADGLERLAAPAPSQPNALGQLAATQARGPQLR